MGGIMNQFTATMMKSSFLKTGAAILMISSGAACGSSDDAGAVDSHTTATGSSGDSASTSGGGNTTGGGSTTGGGMSSSDSGNVGNVASTAAVKLGTAERFAILAKSGISTVPTSAITGDLGVSPAAASYITGFSLTADSTSVFSTSPQVTGNVYASDYTPPTPSNLTTAIGDMQLAFTDAAGRAPNVTELGAGNVGGMTLAPGVYKWSTGLLIPTDVTLTGRATDVWIFQIAQDLTMSSAAKI